MLKDREEIVNTYFSENEDFQDDCFYRQFFEEAPDMFAAVDAKTGQIKTCNKTLCAALGYPKEDIVGKDVHSMYSPECQKEVGRAFKSFIEHGEAESSCLELLKADGSTLEVSLRESSLRNENGEIIESRSIWRDLTLMRQVERLELEVRLQDTEKVESLALLAGGIAHDFNNILASVLGNAGLGMLQYPKESPAQHLFQEIETAAQLAADLTKQLMAYSGSGVNEKSSFDLTKVVAEMGHLLDVAISRKSVLRYDFAHEAINVLGDITQIRQVIMNLLINASDAIGDRSGMITIRTGLLDANPEYLVDTMLGDGIESGYYGFLEVSDTGEGLSLESKNKMFDPFYTTKPTGHGLGLAAVLGILRAHHGTLRVYSEIGNGTTIKVLLPMLDHVEESDDLVSHLPLSSGEHLRYSGR